MLQNHNMLTSPLDHTTSIPTITMPRIRQHSHQHSHKTSKAQKLTHPTPPKHSKKSYSNGALKLIFSGCKMSLAGDFIAEHPDPNAEHQWCYEKISKWIQVHGGEYSREVDENTTHLIVTIKEYKKKTSLGMPLPALKAACSGCQKIMLM